MRQAVMTAPGQIRLGDVPKPAPGPDEVLLKIVRIGVCGSDVHVFHGRHPYTSYPVVQGHEFSAVIEEVGEAVEGLSPGMKVTAMPQIVCGRCGPCRRGDYHICDHLKVQGFQAPGCAQQWFVTAADKIVRLPDGFTFEQGALVEPAAVAVHAVARAGNLAGRNVAVLGAGPIGNLVAQVARAEGADVLATDVSDFRLELVRRCGIAHASNARNESLDEAAARAFGEVGFDVALECAGAEPAVDAAIRAIAKGGLLVVVGVFGEKPRVDLGLVQDRELKLVGTLMYRREDYQRAIELIEAGAILTDPLDTGHFPMRDYEAAYDFIERQSDRSMKVFIDVS
ncbi:MAG TPA: alcohol dehydrogenase catalytic domain-containing protein [Thermoguttaceae bacterium]|nr:alcohol dehydrogenase catalytic domain-containing protein [Thermoguttaceae bacterium]